MKDKEKLKLFISDNLSLFLTSLFTQVLFFGILFYIKGVWFQEIFYFGFLVFFLLLLFLLIRFYKTGRVYGKFFLKSESLNDYLLDEPRSAFEESYNLMIEEMVNSESKSRIEREQDKKLQKVLIYRFVHQMKTPLSVLKLISENHKEEDYRKIQRNIDAIEYNLNQMLDVYRLEEFKNDFVSEKVFLKGVCKDSINALKDYFIASQIYPRLDVDEDMYVYSDSKWLKLVIHQLLTNAIKYSSAGKTVTVRAKREADKVSLSVVDEGIGIEEADLKSIFELFYIGKNGRNNADSSGIGLYIVTRVIEYLGHELETESVVAKGTRMTIIF